MSQGPGFESQDKPRKNWWGRNWKWFLPTVILTPLVICGGGIALVISFVFGMIHDSVPYKDAMKTARQQSQVRQHLGQPIEAGYLTTGNIHYGAGGSGKASLTIPLSGPKGEGTLYVDARRSAGQWQFQRLVFARQGGRTKRIDLLAQP
jgi:hypothetical protein